MSAMSLTCDPVEVGFDPARLARIDGYFAKGVEDGRWPGWLILISRRGEIAHLSACGHRDVAAGLPVEPDTLFRIYSMSKPVTSVALMTLYEEGRLLLTDPVAMYLPEFADMRVYQGGPAAAPATRPAAEPIRVWHLLTHTAGLTYEFYHESVVDEMYRAAGLDGPYPAGLDLAECVRRWAGLPLLFEPGSRWNYSVATDVLGRLIEVISGMPLDRFLAERIFAPLGMRDSGFEPVDPTRMATLYGQARDGQMVPIPPPPARPALLSGGHGLISTAADYHRFTQMLLRGGEFEGARVLGSRTVEYMTRNHLPGGADLEEFGRPIFSEISNSGVGFGLGFAVVQDAVKQKSLASDGEYNWGGAASTMFWVDPAEDLTVIFLSQIIPSTVRPVLGQLRQLVYQALVDPPR
ncbi:serine hydrolase domain-containing protein [Bailinhaonella thermotolerans]|uniref:Class A beta-lactamase-related serine hydrolase n=1 Tax=Bailinhaonella thermotolerans TaxID=1070861 RepID=A0A3A4BBH8_9ACTN|nr:serine hydrolase domain-containing protein [Bailinhaonella thermotolerans]RJL35456.1 class A beta-lactamase-related serine hydrolase [Bailinhaonella thermotolerans]